VDTGQAAEVGQLVFVAVAVVAVAVVVVAVVVVVGRMVRSLHTFEVLVVVGALLEEASSSGVEAALQDIQVDRQAVVAFHIAGGRAAAVERPSSSLEGEPSSPWGEGECWTTDHTLAHRSCCRTLDCPHSCRPGRRFLRVQVSSCLSPSVYPACPVWAM